MWAHKPTCSLVQVLIALQGFVMHCVPWERKQAALAQLGDLLVETVGRFGVSWGCGLCYGATRPCSASYAHEWLQG